jgi:Ca2+/Na+ antiporter
MGFLEDMDRVAVVNDKVQPKPRERQAGNPALIIGFLVFVGLIGIALLVGSNAITSAEAVGIASCIIGIVMMFAVLKLFTIATTLKEILAELRSARPAIAKVPENTKWDRDS